MDRSSVLELAIRLSPYAQVYEQQEEFMRRMIDALAEGKIGLFESPTGTGKTLSMLCAALAFQHTESQMDSQDIMKSSEEPEWLRSSRKGATFDLPDFDNLTPAKKPKRQLKKNKEDPLNLDAKISSLLKAIQSDDEIEEDCCQKKMRRIYFCSRTHSQLSQVMALDLEKYLATTIGSRSHLCINKSVNKLSSVARINEKCLELLQSSTECCPYHNEDKKPSLDLLVDSVKRMQVADVEDLHKMGEKIGSCPYYAVREIQEDANLVTIPYNILLQKETREALGIDLKGSIVIVDEAHNLIDAINQIHSVSISLEQLAKIHGGLATYHEKYRNRMQPSNSLLLQHLIQGLFQTIAYTRSINESMVMTILEFSHSCRIDNLNIFPIQSYIQESKLSAKLCSFYSQMETGDPNLLNELIRFLLMLANADSDGRVYLQKEGERVLVKYISLNPEKYFSDVIEQAHTVILAGGTMSPYEDYIDQLFGPSFPTEKLSQFSCSHLIPKENCLALPVPSGPSGVPFDFSFSGRSNPAVIKELGQTILNLCNITPDGIVCFFPSYSYMNQVIDVWKESGTFESINSKKTTIIESSTQANIDLMMNTYRESILRSGSKGGILFGVMGGRLSEGINFADRLARLVIAVGMPFPNIHEPEMAERLAYYLRRKAAVCLTFNKEAATADFLENICMRSVNQTLGRVIRHRSDYAAMVLLDGRYKKPRIVEKISGWIRQSLSDTDKFGQAFSQLVKVPLRSH